MDIVVTEHYEIYPSWIFFFIIFIIVFIPTILFWISIRKKNLQLAKKIDIVIILSLQATIIGLILSSIVRVVKHTENGGSGAVYYYEIADFGNFVFFISLIILVLCVLFFSYKEIKLIKPIRTPRAILSILVIIIVFAMIVPSLWWNFEEESYSYYGEDYSLEGKINSDDSIELAYNNEGNIHYLKIENNEIISDKKFRTNAFRNILITKNNEKFYYIYGILDPDVRGFDIDLTPTKDIQIIELPKEMYLHNNVEIDENENAHFIVKYDDAITYSVGNDFRYYTIERGYYVYDTNEKNLNKIEGGNYSNVLLDSNSDVYLLHFQTINDTHSGFIVQKRDLEGNIIFNKLISNISTGEYYDLWYYPTGMELDGNNNIHIIFSNASNNLQYLKMDTNGNFLNITILNNTSFLMNYPIINDGNNNWIFFNNFQFFNDEPDIWYGNIDNENNIHIYSISQDHIIYHEVYVYNGTLTNRSSLIEIPPFEEYIEEDEFDFEIMLNNLRVIFLAVTVSLIIIICLNIITFLQYKRLLKKEKKSTINEKGVTN